MAQLVANAMKVFTDLYLQVCKYYTAIFPLTCSQKHCQVHYVYGQMVTYFVSLSENKHERI